MLWVSTGEEQRKHVVVSQADTVQGSARPNQGSSMGNLRNQQCGHAGDSVPWVIKGWVKPSQQ